MDFNGLQLAGKHEIILILDESNAVLAEPASGSPSALQNLRISLCAKGIASGLPLRVFSSLV
jgi:hypothetical protein